MSGDQLAAFTDRLEAIALFEMLRGRDPSKPWPLLPILAFVAPGGSGKSLLLRYLHVEKCSVDGHAAIPYAYLDFTLSHTPKELLPILMELRDQLQKQNDDQGNHLVFPRFDLGALIAQAASLNEDISSLGLNQVRHKLAAGMKIIESLSAVGSSLGYAVPYVGPLIAGLHLTEQIKPLSGLLNYLEDNTGWKWYRMHGTETGLWASATMKDVLLRLYVLSMPGRSERDLLVNNLLPAAFLADLFDMLLNVDPPRAWSNRSNVVIFLDGFEALQHASSNTAIHLLQVLTTIPRKNGKTDPLLIVVGSQEYLPGSDRRGEFRLPFQRTAELTAQDMLHEVQERHTHWQQFLPSDKHILRLKDLYLTFELQDFCQADTSNYLLKLGELKQTRVFADNSALVETINQLTHGHPFYLALAAAAVLEAKARGQDLMLEDFEMAEVSPEIAPEHEVEYIRDFLLDLFLRQLSESKRKELIFCAVPRFLDSALLRVLLPMLDDIDRQRRWKYYQRLTFMRPVAHYRIVFHPLVRTLLIHQLPADQIPESDYYRIHAHLKDYFHTLASKQNHSRSQEIVAEQAKIEEAYHALALGDPDPAIMLGIFTQRSNFTLWGPLLEAVAQAPVELRPEDIEDQANDAVVRGMHHVDVQDLVKSIILYTWLLATTKETSVEWAMIQNNMGIAYSLLPGGDRQTNVERAIECYQRALQVYTPEAFPRQWAHAKNNLGNVFRRLPGGDRKANVERAIECYLAALQVRTRKAFPEEWAMAQGNLGNAYFDLPGRDRQKNLEQAIEFHKAALEVYMPDTFPVEWARTQNNLGNAYNELLAGDRQENLEQAIKCYKSALKVRTREAFPVNWAETQNNLGAAYAQLPRGDKEKNLRQAIEHCKAALKVYTYVDFPVEWAMAQDTLGNVYAQLSEGDRQTNVERAIECYLAALEVRTRDAFPVEWARTQGNLGNAYRELPAGDRQENLEQAIKCYESVLQVLQSMNMEHYLYIVEKNLEDAKEKLRNQSKAQNQKKI